MEQQQIELDETFMRNNGWQCKPISEYPVRLQALFIKREREERNEEDDGDSELVKTIKRLRKNKIHCQPYDYLNVKLQAMMMRGPMSLDDAVRLQQQQLESLHSPPVPQYPLPPVLPPVLPPYPLPHQYLPDAAIEVAAEAAARGARRQADIDAQYFRDLLAGRYKAPSSPIDIRPGKKGGKKRSYKKRTNTKKRSTKKRTNAKKRSYKKRN